jgi:sorbitol-specific phosphotransferase system component IIC
VGIQIVVATTDKLMTKIAVGYNFLYFKTGKACAVSMAGIMPLFVSILHQIYHIM